jgi:hypothetical protein
MLTATAGALAAMLLLSLTAVGAEGPPNHCEVVSGTGQCLVGAVDPGRQGGTAHKPRSAPDHDEAPAPHTVEPPRPLPDGAQTGADLGLPNQPGAANPAALPPAVIAQQAIKSLGLRGPHVRTSVVGSTFVGAPLCLWIDQGDQFTGPLSRTATAGAAQVTVTGTLTAVQWDLGPPDGHVRCTGPGTPWAGQVGPSPNCGYTYTERSLPERTNGTSRWPITATSVWQVNWTGTSAGVPVNGAQTVRIPAQASLAVGEVQVLVAGS